MPSPASERPAPSPQRDGQLPWESALYDAVAKVEARAVAAERERDELFKKVYRLENALREARRRLQNWELRRQAWTRERDELLRRLGEVRRADPHG